MIVTKRTEIFYKIEMTAAQAADLLAFFVTMQDRHKDEIIRMLKTTRSDEIRESIDDFLNALESV